MCLAATFDLYVWANLISVCETIFTNLQVVQSDNDFHCRGRTHLQCSQLNKVSDSGSSFYINYPSKDAGLPPRVRDATKGTVENDTETCVAVVLTEYGVEHASDVVRGKSLDKVQSSKASGTTHSKSRDIVLFSAEQFLSVDLPRDHALKNGNDSFESHRPMFFSSSSQRVGAVQKLVGADLRMCSNQKLYLLRNSITLFVKSDRDREKYRHVREQVPRVANNTYAVLSNEDAAALQSIEESETWKNLQQEREQKKLQKQLLIRSPGGRFTTSQQQQQREKERQEEAAREAADRPIVFEIITAAFRSVIAEGDTKTKSLLRRANIRALTRDRAVENLRGREDLTWSGLFVYDMADTMAKTFKQSLVDTDDDCSTKANALI